MSENQELTAKKVSDDLEKLLNTHGFGFQNAVIKCAQDLTARGECGWMLEASEIPVGGPGEQTHIDFVFDLIPKGYAEKRKAYLIGECKRVDPAKANWLFVKNPRKVMYPNRIENYIQIDSIIPNEGAAINKTHASTKVTHTDVGTYDLGFESKTNLKGDGIGSHDRSLINQALGQVFRAQKGFINYLDSLTAELRLAKLQKEAIFIPAIFTTADLYTSAVRLDGADITSGILPKGSVAATKVPWLWFNHNRFLEGTPFPRNREKDRDAYFGDFTRSVAIVSPTGMEEFMKIDLLQLFRW